VSSFMLSKVTGLCKSFPILLTSIGFYSSVSSFMNS
jgi:hypothetical protein